MTEASDRTMRFSAEELKNGTKGIIREVYRSLEEKGYDPVSQIVGYLMSGDPTYITSHNNARTLIRSVSRDALIEELVRGYMSK
ncbi:MAG: IreB family regulatory phosphoprotein [Firmicutes bacterium]|nr:IreB family regulatory phosphoprotein [Bacillota bacterium]MDD4262975.1 IreB family regulatory phosphoprotein [Bacillota bacterium]MDD4693843.1 IreB family regulatory phosphoprotein [Bacillota bacterium]